MLIGVLAMQGDIDEHLNMLKLLGVPALRVVTSQHLSKVDGIIFPGGESTAMLRLLRYKDFFDDVRKAIIEDKMPVYGTCAGAILLSRKVENYPEQQTFNAIDVIIRRNAYGSQVHSFKTVLDINEIGEIETMFIRAPKIISIGEGVEVMAKHEDEVVMVKQNNVIISTFHPEIAKDTKVHEYFISFTKSAK